MRIVIVGAGRMGFSLAQDLDREGHEVSLVDMRPEAAELAQTRLDVMAVTGSGCSRASLTEAGAREADILLAVTGSDEVNIVSSLIGRELGIKQRMARIESRALLADINDLQKVMGVDEYVSPREVTLDRLRRILALPGVTEFADFADGQIVLRALCVDRPSPLVELPLSELRTSFAEPFLVTAVRRNDELVVPTGNFRIQLDDIIYVVMKEGVEKSFLRRYKLAREKNHKLFVYGATDTGLDVCNIFAGSSYEVILLEKDPLLCEAAAKQINHASIIQGSPLDVDLMRDLRIEGSFFLSLTESAEVNFSSAVMAKRIGAERAIMLAPEPEGAQTFDVPPLDAVISPISLSVGAVLRSVRAGRVISLFKLAAARGEAIEVEAQADAPGTGRPLHKIKFPEGVVVAAVTGNGKVEVASGETVIQPGDHVIMVALNRAVHDAIEIFTNTTSGSIT